MVLLPLLVLVDTCKRSTTIVAINQLNETEQKVNSSCAELVAPGKALESMIMDFQPEDSNEQRHELNITILEQSFVRQYNFSRILQEHL